MLRYGPIVKLVSIEKNDDGSINHVKVEILPEYQEKIKGVIHWVSKENSSTVTANLYSVHFMVENVAKEGDKWLDAINPNSLVVKNNAKVWKLHDKAKEGDRFQFERAGYFILDQKVKNGQDVYNRIVELKESKDKVVNK
jgi:glutaminyl-tRNA synthetase